MEFFRIRRDIPFMRHALVLNAISAITFLAAVFFLVTKGLHLSVEFTGGTVMEISYQQTAPLNTIRADLTKLGYQDVQVQNFGSSKDVLIRLPLQRDAEGKALSSSQQSNQVLDTLKASNADVTLKRRAFWPTYTTL
ncbi:MAG: hypothetical protein RL604_1158 [Pseudomonadota bacterium]